MFGSFGTKSTISWMLLWTRSNGVVITFVVKADGFEVIAVYIAVGATSKIYKMRSSSINVANIMHFWIDHMHDDSSPFMSLDFGTAPFLWV